MKPASAKNRIATIEADMMEAQALHNNRQYAESRKLIDQVAPVASKLRYDFERCAECTASAANADPAAAEYWADCSEWAGRVYKWACDLYYAQDGVK